MEGEKPFLVTVRSSSSNKNILEETAFSSNEMKILPYGGLRSIEDLLWWLVRALVRGNDLSGMYCMWPSHKKFIRN